MLDQRQHYTLFSHLERKFSFSFLFNFSRAYYNQTWDRTQLTAHRTGKPKGVQVQHQAFCSSVAGKASVYCRTAESRMLSFASWAFDSSLDELFVTLAVGGTVCIPNDEERTNDLVGFINRMGINTVDLPQSVVNLFYSSEVPSVEVVIIGGEEMSKATIERWCKHVALVNAYGPTEASVTSVA